MSFKGQNKGQKLFLAQGVAGGALGGFVYVFLITLWVGSPDFWTVLSSTPRRMFLGSIIGVIEAASICGLYSATGIQPRAAMRATIASIVATLIVGLIQFETAEKDLTNYLIATMSFAVPPALIIGSNFRPAELFAFGTIGVRGEGFDELYESTSPWAIAGTLPLRFLSFGIAGIWLLSIAREPKGEPPYIGVVIVSVIPLLYLGISAFLTFRSPGKLLLLLLGIGGNIPVVLGNLLSMGVYQSYPTMEELLILSIICWAFLITWAIFLFARLSVGTRHLMPLSVVPDKGLSARSEDYENCDHWSSGFRRHPPDTSSRI